MFHLYGKYRAATAGWRVIGRRKGFIEKRARLQYFQGNPVRLRTSLANPESCYRNCITMVDDPKSLDRMTLMLTGVYKFARHEWVGIKGGGGLRT